MNFKVIVKPSAEKSILRLDESDYKAIFERIRALAQEPRPFGVKKLAIGGLWRLRVRDFRVIYSIDDEKKLVIVAKVARRSEGTYKGF